MSRLIKSGDLMKKILVPTLLIFLFAPLFTLGQSGSLVITEGNEGTDYLAVLSLVSDKKGVLIPRMTYDQMQKIENPKDGLSVYVEDSMNEGIWFWDGVLGDWKKLDVIDPNQTAVTEPVGSIAMYSGDLTNFDANGIGLSGTDAEGWALCDGNGRPDLRKRFVVGYGKEDQTGTSADYPTYTYGTYADKPDSFQLSTSNLFPHTHKITDEGKSVTVEHKHAVSPGSHYHTIAGVTGRNSNHKGEQVRPTKNNPRHHNGPFELDENSGIIVVKPPTNTSIIYQFPNDYLTYSGGIVDTNTTAQNYQVKAFEARPPYYVLAFIIKL